ncbi:MAG: hypothetical protein JWN44_5793, partial [Myxococcales bacterium]|nr:hypothetical protein [Myxococcales bacterium]
MLCQPRAMTKQSADALAAYGVRCKVRCAAPP